jgi:queuosine precursor transporter
VLTEVYGYANARRCIWAGFVAMVFMAFMSWAVVAMPPAATWDGQAAYESVFGQVPRIVVASMLAFWAGEFVNSFVLSRMKVWTRGKHLWSRTIGSTVFGQAVDSLIFYPVAFLGVWETEVVVTVMVTNWLLKVLWEALLTPVTYAVVGAIKRREGVEVFDTGRVQPVRQGGRGLTNRASRLWRSTASCCAISATTGNPRSRMQRASIC